MTPILVPQSHTYSSPNCVAQPIFAPLSYHVSKQCRQICGTTPIANTYPLLFHLMTLILHLLSPSLLSPTLQTPSVIPLHPQTHFLPLSQLIPKMDLSFFLLDFLLQASQH